MRYGGNTTCVEVRTADDRPVILDAGTGLRLLGLHLTEMPDGHDGGDAPLHLLLTHRHSDHVIGLPHFAPLFTNGRPLTITAGNCAASEARPVLEALLTPPFFPPLVDLAQRIDVRDMPAGAPLELPGCTVHAFEARHPGGAAIFRLDDAHGAAIAFAPDNELDYASDDPDVIAWRRGLVLALHAVPILLHDATYADDELAAHRGWGHSSALEATRFAIECGAGMLVLCHHHPDRSDDAVDESVQQCRQLVASSGSALRVLAAWEGLALSV